MENCLPIETRQYVPCAAQVPETLNITAIPLRNEKRAPEAEQCEKAAGLRREERTWTKKEERPSTHADWYGDRNVMMLL